MKKISLKYSILICLIISISVRGQSKKKQIEILKGKVDSLNEVVFKERNYYIQGVQLKDAEISSQKNQINRLIQRNDSLNEVVFKERNYYIQGVQLKDAEISSQKNQINRLIQRNDSLNTQLNEIEGDKMILIQKYSSLERRIDSLNQKIAEESYKLDSIDIDVFLEPYSESASWLSIKTEPFRRYGPPGSSGYVLIINNGGPFEERYFLEKIPMSNTYDLILLGGEGSISFNEAVTNSGFYTSCKGKKYGEVTIKEGVLEIMFEPKCNSNINSFNLTVNTK